MQKKKKKFSCRKNKKEKITFYRASLIRPMPPNQRGGCYAWTYFMMGI